MTNFKISTLFLTSGQVMVSSTNSKENYFFQMMELLSPRALSRHGGLLLVNPNLYTSASTINARKMNIRYMEE